MQEFEQTALKHSQPQCHTSFNNYINYVMKFHNFGLH